MSIGRKIGLGFCAVIALTLILGLWAIVAMNRGANVAEVIATDRLPRVIEWTDMQNDLLEGAYVAQDYFQGGDEAQINKAYDFLKEFENGIQAVAALNAKIPYPDTARALEKAKADCAAYSDLLHKGQKLYEDSEQLVVNMAQLAREALGGFEQLINTMGATLEDFIRQGEMRTAQAYVHNLVAANEVYAQIGGIYQDLLMAERNNDIPAFTSIEKRLPEITEMANQVDKGLVRPEGHRIFTQAMAKYTSFAKVANQVAATLKEFIEQGKKRYSHFYGMYEDTIKIVDRTTKNSNQFAIQAQSDLAASTMVVTSLLVAAVILGIIVAIYITRLIVKPLSATQQFAVEVAQGNLDRELDVRTNDETGKLAAALRSMVGALKQNISEAREKSEEAQQATEKATAATARAEEAARRAESAKKEGMLSAANQLEKMVEIISSASTQLSAQIEQSDHGAAESAQRLQEAATAMNQMNATVQEVARNAGSASEASSETRRKAQAGQKVVHEVVDSIADVQQTSMLLKKDMAQLNERAQDINRIMGVISDIADQTNLLALNAAIEAARAGEAGRGFAVVADEVRKLAEKTMTSTQDVSSAIHAIQESTSKSMAAVDNAVDSIGKATELANQSGGALEEIVVTVEATSDQVQAIAAASEEQSAASEEINRSITEVNDMSRMTAEAMREAAVAVSDLADQAQRLNGLIEDMKKA